VPNSVGGLEKGPGQTERRSKNSGSEKVAGEGKEVRPIADLRLGNRCPPFKAGRKRVRRLGRFTINDPPRCRSGEAGIKMGGTRRAGVGPGTGPGQAVVTEKKERWTSGLVAISDFEREADREERAAMLELIGLCNEAGQE